MNKSVPIYLVLFLLRHREVKALKTMNPPRRMMEILPLTWKTSLRRMMIMIQRSLTMTQTKVARMMVMTRAMGMTMTGERRRNLAPVVEVVRGGARVSGVKQPRERERIEHLQEEEALRGFRPKEAVGMAGTRIVERSRGMVRRVEAKGVRGRQGLITMSHRR